MFLTWVYSYFLFSFTAKFLQKVIYYFWLQFFLYAVAVYSNLLKQIILNPSHWNHSCKSHQWSPNCTILLSSYLIYQQHLAELITLLYETLSSSGFQKIYSYGFLPSQPAIPLFSLLILSHFLDVLCWSVPGLTSYLYFSTITTQFRLMILTTEYVL